MTIINYETFKTEVFNWANQNSERFKRFWPLAGGWEAWVQAEVAGYILQVDSTDEIVREPAGLYNNDQSPDWGLNLIRGEEYRIAVELKCQRGSDLSGKTFVKDIQSDVKKLNPGNLKEGVQRAIVGIYYSEPAFTEISQVYKLDADNHNQYNGEVGVFVLYGGLDFPRPT